MLHYPWLTMLHCICGERDRDRAINHDARDTCRCSTLKSRANLSPRLDDRWDDGIGNIILALVLVVVDVWPCKGPPENSTLCISPWVVHKWPTFGAKVNTCLRVITYLFIHRHWTCKNNLRILDEKWIDSVINRWRNRNTEERGGEREKNDCWDGWSLLS